MDRNSAGEDLAPLTLSMTSDPADLTRQLCDIASVSGNEGPIADAVADFLRNLSRYDVTRYGNTVVARTTGGARQRIILAGHLDTVPLAHAGQLPTWVVGEGRDEKIYGRGTCDMKGGVAVQLAIAAQVLDPRCELTFIFYDGEEIAAQHNGLLALSRAHPDLMAGDFAVLLEPTQGQCEGGCNGTMRADITTTGKAAHSARAWMGHNAIHDVAPILAKLRKFQPDTIHVDGLDYREGLNAVAISGGIAGNVIPDRCTVTVNFRFAPSRSEAQAEEFLRELFSDCTLEVTDSAPGARPGLDQPLVQEFVQALGIAARPKYGWTDVARFSGLGIPAVNFGPGDPLTAHADDEHVLAQEVRDCATVLAQWLSRVSPE